MRSLTLAPIIILAIFFISCNQGEDRFSPEQKAAINAATNWLKLMDAGEFSQSWKNAAPTFKANMTERQWIIGLEYMRAPYGRAVSHEIKSCQLDDYNSNLGHYTNAAIECRTTFENQKKVTEFINLYFVDNSWRVAIYYLDR